MQSLYDQSPCLPFRFQKIWSEAIKKIWCRVKRYSGRTSLSGRSFLLKSDSFSIPEIGHKGGNQARHHNHCKHNSKDQFLTGKKGCQNQDDACREEAFSTQTVGSAPVFFAAKGPWSPDTHEEIAFHLRQFISNKEEQNTDGDRNYPVEY